MQYFTNVHLAKLYAVSEGTVRRWIDSAREGKLDLQLYEHGGKRHIANTTKNKVAIEELVAQGKKHRNTRWRKTISPVPEFYELYGQKQILDIISNIDVHREIPRDYSYLGNGAHYWDEYAERLWHEDAENTLVATIELLQANRENIDRFLKGHERVNIIDIGVGNALPVKELLTTLLYEQDTLGRYIGVDISPDMLTIAERNIKQWFDGRVNFEGHTRDITYERFDDLLAGDDPGTTANLVLLLGGTLNNFRSPDEVLRTIYHSVGRSDLFITSMKLDSDEARRYFDFNPKPGLALTRLARAQRVVLDLLNIDESLYEVEQLYDDVRQARLMRIRFKMDLTIRIDLGASERLIELRKDEPLLVWRVWHQQVGSVVRLLERNGFAQLETSTTADRQYLLTISKIDTEA